MSITSSIFRPGATALITGGASGIGLALARHCFSSGMNVHIADINKTTLSSAISSFPTNNDPSQGSIHSHELDVASLKSWSNLKQTFSSQNLSVDFLALNAAIGGSRTLSFNLHNDNSQTIPYWREIMETNLFGVINGLDTFLPDFTSSTNNPDKDGGKKDKAIVITGSKQGITNPPGNPAYNAAKAAIKSLTEQLHFSLSMTAPHVAVRLLVPGWTYTGIGNKGVQGDSGEKPSGAWMSEQVVEYLVKKMGEQEEGCYVVCPDNDVDEITDKKRVIWAAKEVVEDRQPLSRWREDVKDEVKREMEGIEV